MTEHLLVEIPTLDRLLDDHAAELGRDFTGYRNHTYRVANLCVLLSPDAPERLEKIAIAAAFHDMGIWTDGTFDYLEPSIRLAREHLVRLSRTEWTSEITAMILEHHKISRCPGDSSSLVEAFRRADWVDVSRGLVRFGVPRAYLTAMYSRWPSAGFHKRLVQLSCRRLLTHPWSPLPMLRR